MVFEWDPPNTHDVPDESFQADTTEVVIVSSYSTTQHKGSSPLRVVLPNGRIYRATLRVSNCAGKNSTKNILTIDTGKG